MIGPALHRLAYRAERAIDARVARGGRERPVIEPYAGYATPEGAVARGRVLSALRRGQPLPTQSRWTNFRQMVALFATGEVAGVTVISGRREAVSDAQGYFALQVDRPATPGWHDVPVRCEGFEEGEAVPVLVPRPDAASGVISDIDDTMMHTGAYSLARNLWTTFTGNALTREVFPDAVALMAALHEGGRNPVFYVSSSPWNLHVFLAAVFARAGLPEGPKFLRDYGISKASIVADGHRSHKGAAIDTILAANPDLPFVLIGDTGQHDAEVYRDAVRRHGGRIARVILRRPGPEAEAADPASRAAMAEMRAMGVEVLAAADFRGLAEAAPAGLRAAG